MKDNRTVAFDVKGFPLTRRSWRRWLGKKKNGKYAPRFRRLPTVLTIWHVDPNGDRGRPCGPAKHWQLHVHHWKINVEPWLRFRRRFEKCDGCGRRMNTAERNGYMSSDKVWHSECMSLRHLKGQELIWMEVMHRIFFAYSIDTKEDLRSIVVNPFDERDQFLLWYRPIKAMEHYRKPDTDKWRSPNEHLLDIQRTAQGRE